MADRYMYLPLLGLIVIAVSIAADLLPRLPYPRRSAPSVSALVVAALSVLTWTQQAYWRDGYALFSHAIAVRPDNVPARVQLGVVHLMAGDGAAAEEQLRAALKYDPKSAQAWSNLGSALRMQGDKKGAEEAFRNALTYDAEAYAPALNLAALLGGKKKMDEAIAILERITKTDEETGQGLLLLGDFYVMRGRSEDAARVRAEAEERAHSF
jgi:Tfp pilus assembly protein PilF